MTTILLVEDEEPIRDMLQFSLTKHGFFILEAENAQQAYAILATHVPDLILLDLMLPKISGIDLMRKLKQQSATKDIPIIMLTARAEEECKVQALEVGADDYVVKPFSPKELMARIKAVLRRGVLLSPDGDLELGDLQFNVEKQQLKIVGTVLTLTVIERKLLHFFLTHQDRSYSRSQLLNHVWGGILEIDERTVDVQIGRLRRKLKPFGYDQCFVTLRGVGYQFSGASLNPDE